MNKTLKIILIVILVLAVPGGVIISYFLAGKPQYYVVSDFGNDDANDRLNKVFNIYKIAAYLGVDVDELLKSNPGITDAYGNADVTYVKYGTKIKYAKNEESK